MGFSGEQDILPKFIQCWMRSRFMGAQTFSFLDEKLAQRLLSDARDELIDEAALGEEFRYRCLTTFKPRLDSRTGAGILTIVTASCGSSVIWALTSTDSFLLTDTSH